MNRPPTINAAPIYLVCLTILAGFTTMASTQMQSVLPALAVVYVIVILIIGWTNPYIVLLLSMAAAPFVMSVSGTGFLNFSLTEINILVLTICVIGRNLLSRRVLSIGKLAIPVTVYLSIATIASIQGGLIASDIIALVQTAIFCFLCPLLAINANLTPEKSRNLLLSYAMSCLLLAVLQLFSGVGSMVFGINKNNMGQNLSTGLVVWICLWMDSMRGWWSRLTLPAMTITLLGLIVTLSRGAWVGALIGLIVITVLHRRFTFLVKITAILVPVVSVMWVYLPSDSKEYATGFDRREHRNINARYRNRDVALTAFSSNPLLGTGVSLRKEIDATNLMFVTLGESGILGMAAFVAIQLAYVILILGLVKSVPRSDPRYFIIVVSPTLMAVRLAHGQFDHYWVRGATTMAWISVGVVLTTAVEMRRRNSVLRNVKVVPQSVLDVGGLDSPASRQ